MNARLSPLMAIGLAAMIVAPSPAAADTSPAVADADSASSEALGAWGDSLELDPRVTEQMRRYSQEPEEWSENYAPELAALLRQRLFAAAREALRDLDEGRAEAFVSVSWMDPDNRDGRREAPGKVGRRFESSIVRTEQLGFIPATRLTPAEALAAFVAPDFRLKSSSRIERLWTEAGLSCIETKGLWGLLDPTLVCNRIDTLLLPELACEHSQAVANPGDEDYQIVYFKESLKTFVALPSGLAFHYINYTRSAHLSGLKKRLGKGRIASSQDEKLRLFIEGLRNAESGAGEADGAKSASEEEVAP